MKSKGLIPTSYMGYETYKKICLRLAEQIMIDNCNVLVAVNRGGLSAAHIIAKKLRMEVRLYDPITGFVGPEPPDNDKIAFIEDLVATGRTYDTIETLMRRRSKADWKMYAVLVDRSYDVKCKKISYGIMETAWIVFPYEELNNVTQDDRGLFRDGSDQYGK